MAAGPIGSVWKTGTWPDTTWSANTWANAVIPPVPPVVVAQTLSGGGKRTWKELFPGEKDPNVYVELSAADKAMLGFQDPPTREEAMLLAMLLFTVDEELH